MEKYLLIYEDHNYPEKDGGTHYETFDSVDALERHANKLQEELKENFEILYCAKIFETFNLKAVKHVTKWEADL